MASTTDLRHDALAALPWRGPGSGRPELPLPPAGLPVRRAGRLRKRWRYVGLFADELFLVCARVEVGPLGQTFWALLDRTDGELTESTRLRVPGARGQVWSEGPDGRPWTLGSDEEGTVTRIDAPGIDVRLRFGAGLWAESVCPTVEGSYVWTRKRAGVPIECDLRTGGERRRIEGRGIEDESAGYHPRRTVGSWSAGVGAAADGRQLAWNLVEGINDPPRGSERAIWVDGEAREPGPVRFAEDLGSIAFEDGERLRFSAEGERVKSERKPYLSYHYRQPFGTFAGSLDGIGLADGVGVMEFHDARW